MLELSAMDAVCTRVEAGFTALPLLRNRAKSVARPAGGYVEFLPTPGKLRGIATKLDAQDFIAGFGIYTPAGIGNGPGIAHAQAIRSLFLHEELIPPSGSGDLGTLSYREAQIDDFGQEKTGVFWLTNLNLVFYNLSPRT